MEFWINELRLTGLDERGGYALQAKAEMNLADLGNISIAGNYNSLGWGGLDQRIDQRALSTTQQFDANLKLELSKFLPKNLDFEFHLMPFIQTHYSHQNLIQLIQI